MCTNKLFLSLTYSLFLSVFIAIYLENMRHMYTILKNRNIKKNTAFLGYSDKY